MCVLDTADAIAALYGPDGVWVESAASDAVCQAKLALPGEETLELGWSDDAEAFVAELKRRQDGLNLVEEQGMNELGGIRRLVLLQGEGKWQVHDIWMDIDGIMRLAVASSASRQGAVFLVAQLAHARDRGHFGGHAKLAGPLPAPDQEQ